MQEGECYPINDQIRLEVEKLLFIVNKGLEVQKLYCIYQEITRTDDFENNEKAILIRNAISDEMVIIWNIVFGNIDRNQTHFRNIADWFQFPFDEAKRKFLNTMSINDDQYNSMHEELRNWRNKQVAHLDFNYVTGHEMRLNTDYYELIRLQFSGISLFILDFLVEYFDEMRDFSFQYQIRYGELRQERSMRDFINDRRNEWINQMNDIDEILRNFNS